MDRPGRDPRRGRGLWTRGAAVVVTLSALSFTTPAKADITAHLAVRWGDFPAGAGAVSVFGASSGSSKGTFLSLAADGRSGTATLTFADAGMFSAFVTFTSCGPDAYDLQDGMPNAFSVHCVSNTGDPASPPGAR